MATHRMSRPRPRDGGFTRDTQEPQQTITPTPIKSQMFMIIVAVVAIIVFVAGSMLQINPTITFLCALAIIVFGIYRQYYR